MNPISHHQIGQMTHREYEARYGARAQGKEERKPVSFQRVVLSLGSAAAVALALIQWLA